MERPAFIDERADSGAVRTQLRRLDDDIAMELHIAREMPAAFQKTQDMRITALRTMRVKAAAYFLHLRQIEEAALV